MSSKLHGLVWEGCAFTGMTLSRVAVMARLADYSNDEGVSWPAVETIRRQIGARSESTVKSAIAELEKNGWLTKTERKAGGRNLSNIYQINVEKLEAAAAAAREAYRPKKRDKQVNPSNIDPSKFDGPTVDKNSPVKGAIVDPDPSVLKPDPSDIKPSCPDAAQPDQQTADQRFLTRHPDAVVFNSKKYQWGTQDDLTCAQWLWKKIITRYEQAAESDDEPLRPNEPNWTVWANDIRLMRVQDGHTHKQICKLYQKVNRDPFWCWNVLSPAKLRVKWNELVLRRLGAVSAGDKSLSHLLSGDWNTADGWEDVL